MESLSVSRAFELIVSLAVSNYILNEHLFVRIFRNMWFEKIKMFVANYNITISLSEAFAGSRYRLEKGQGCRKPGATSPVLLSLIGGLANQTAAFELVLC